MAYFFSIEEKEKRTKELPLQSVNSLFKTYLIVVLSVFASTNLSANATFFSIEKSSSETVFSKLDDAFSQLDKTSIIAGVGEIKIVFTAGNYLKSIIVSDLIGSSAGLLVNVLNESAISPSTRYKIQMLSIVASLPQLARSIKGVDNLITAIDNDINALANINSKVRVKDYFSKIKLKVLVESDLASFMSKSLSDKLAYIDNIWKTKYPIPDMLRGRSFFEDIMGQYRYTKSSGWLHTGDISSNFKGIDFYKGTESANQIFANTAVSMKTTISTNVDTWLASAPMQKNVKFLKEGLDPSIGLVSNGKTMFITNAKIDIYMPKANITPALKTQWMNKLNTVDPDITFEIKALEDFIN